MHTKTVIVGSAEGLHARPASSPRPPRSTRPSSRSSSATRRPMPTPRCSSWRSARRRALRSSCAGRTPTRCPRSPHSSSRISTPSSRPRPTPVPTGIRSRACTPNPHPLPSVNSRPRLGARGSTQPGADAADQCPRHAATRAHTAKRRPRPAATRAHTAEPCPRPAKARADAGASEPRLEWVDQAGPQPPIKHLLGMAPQTYARWHEIPRATAPSEKTPNRHRRTKR